MKIIWNRNFVNFLKLIVTTKFDFVDVYIYHWFVQILMYVIKLNSKNHFDVWNIKILKIMIICKTTNEMKFNQWIKSKKIEINLNSSNKW